MLMVLADSEVMSSLFSGGGQKRRVWMQKGSLAVTGKLQAHEGGAHCLYDSTPFSLCPHPMHTQIQFFLYFLRSLSCNSRNICAGRGSTGRVRDTWCTEKILLIPSFFLFSCSFSSAMLISQDLVHKSSNFRLPLLQFVPFVSKVYFLSSEFIVFWVSCF